MIALALAALTVAQAGDNPVQDGLTVGLGTFGVQLLGGGAGAATGYFVGRSVCQGRSHQDACLDELAAIPGAAVGFVATAPLGAGLITLAVDRKPWPVVGVTVGATGLAAGLMLSGSALGNSDGDGIQRSAVPTVLAASGVFIALFGVAGAAGTAAGLQRGGSVALAPMLGSGHQGMQVVGRL